MSIDNMIRKKTAIVLLAAAIAAACLWAAWSRWGSATRIGLVNFQNFQTTSFVKSNEDRFVEYETVPLDRLDRLSRYDFVLGFGMGLHITEEQRALIRKAADRGRPSTSMPRRIPRTTSRRSTASKRRACSPT